MPGLTEHYNKGVQAIVKPLKIEYSVNDLGPAKFNVGGSMVIRTDFTLTNKRNGKLACSFFEHSTSEIPLPMVIYCHANGSCRLEALQYKQMILSSKFHYFCFDFTACGSSEGEYGSIGHYEQDDLDAVLSHVKGTGKVTKIALWGRSMGAVTSIMYSAKNPIVSCIVLDSPYATFKRLVTELAKNKASVPNFLTKWVLGMLRKSVKKKAKFDVYELTPIDYVGRLTIPALFGAPKDDTFVSPQHTKDLFMNHSGPKQLGIFEGDHNSQRPLDWIQRVVEFIKQHLNDEKKLDQYGHPQQNMQSQYNQVQDRFSQVNQANTFGNGPMQNRPMEMPKKSVYNQDNYNEYNQRNDFGAGLGDGNNRGPNLRDNHSFPNNNHSPIIMGDRGHNLSHNDYNQRNDFGLDNHNIGNNPRDSYGYQNDNRGPNLRDSYNPHQNGPNFNDNYGHQSNNRGSPVIMGDNRGPNLRDSYSPNQGHQNGPNFNDNYGQSNHRGPVIMGDNHGYNDNRGPNLRDSYNPHQSHHNGPNLRDNYGHNQQNNYDHGHQQRNEYDQGYDNRNLGQSSHYGYQAKPIGFNTQGTFGQESNLNNSPTHSYGYNHSQNYIPVNTESRILRPMEQGYPGRI